MSADIFRVTTRGVRVPTKHHWETGTVDNRTMIDVVSDRDGKPLSVGDTVMVVSMANTEDTYGYTWPHTLYSVRTISNITCDAIEIEDSVVISAKDVIKQGL